MESVRARPLSATARGALLGALGGMAAGLCDYAFGAAGARQFLPDGSARLGLFLIALYGAAAAAGGAIVGLGLALLARGTDLGALWRSAFSDESAREARMAGTPLPEVADGRPLLAYALAVPSAAALHGLWVRLATTFALQRFHSPLLISALVGAEAAALAIPALLVALLLAALFGLGLPVGRRLRPAARLAPGLLVASFIIGLGLGAGAVALLVSALQQNRRMALPLRALNAGLFSPLLVAAALLAAHTLARLLAPRLPRSIRAACERPIAAIAIGFALASVAAASLLAAAWPIAKLLPLRALVVAAVAPVVALLLALSPRLAALVDRRSAAARFALVFCAPALLLALALQAGRADRVRKAAAIHSALSGPLLDGLHAAWDLDRDGYSPLLGSDCNDLDPDVHPGAFDWPDDGIDQNCNGHQATLHRTNRPLFTPLPDAVPRRPNVLLITIDALRADHVGAYGYGRPTTPRIDELARESVLFENGWAHSPSTRFSVPAILTGRYESKIAWGSDHWPPTVLPENRLMAEAFHDLGYRTAAILPAPYFLPRAANARMSMWGLDQGFDDYDTSLAPLHSHADGDPAKATGSSSKQLADLAVKWIGANAASQQDRPFFLWLHFYDPHYLYERHPDCPDCQYGEKSVDLYDGEVRYTDLHIGRVLDALRASGAWDRTAIVLTADHGEGFGEHGINLHGYNIYSAQNKVPFLARVPGIAPRRVAEPVGHVDIFPSLLNLLRAPDEPQLLGRSFLDLMLGGPQGEAPRLVFGEVDYEGPTQMRSVASRTHHLIDNVIPDGTYEYYDVEHDPMEAHDLFERGAGGEEGRLFAALGEWMDESALPADFAARVTGNIAMQQIPFAEPLAADLGGILTVDGATVVTPEVKAGEPAEVDLVLRVPARVPAGWRLFTHAAAGGADPKLHGPAFLNLDHEPVEGFVPLARLRPGQWVRDRIKFTVPPSWRGATVSLQVGLFKGKDRAPVSRAGAAAGDQLIAATLLVLP